MYTIYHKTNELWSTDDPELADLYHEHCVDICPEKFDDIWISQPVAA